MIVPGMKGEDYGKYFNLTTRESNTVKSIIKAISGHKRMVLLPKLVDREQLNRIIKIILENEAAFFFVREVKTIISQTAFTLEPLYLYSKQESETVFAKCQEQAKIILAKSISHDPYDTALNIHDVLARNVKYVKGNNNELHSIMSPLIRKQGVCEGYAKTFKFLMDLTGIPCVVIYGRGFNPLDNTEESHAWNMILLGRKWCHVDVTFDSTIRMGDMDRRDYFGLTTEQILRDHSFDIAKYPRTMGSDQEFYRKNNLYMDTKSRLASYVLLMYRNHINDAVIRLPDNSTEEGLENQVLNVISETLTTHQIEAGVKVYFNPKQRVFQIHID